MDCCFGRLRMRTKRFEAVRGIVKRTLCVGGGTEFLVATRVDIKEDSLGKVSLEVACCMNAYNKTCETSQGFDETIARVK
jgi:hypothetical protein